MISNVRSYIAEFKKRDGLYIAISALIVKVIGLIISVFVIRMIDKAEFGYIAFALSIIAVLSAFSGLGMNWSLLRYGALEKTISGKKNIYFKSIKIGAVVTLILILLVSLCSVFLPKHLEDSSLYLIILSLGLLGNFLLDSLRSFYRIVKKNRTYANINVAFIFVLIVTSVVGIYFYDGYGYVFALVLTPLLVFFIFQKGLNFKHSNNLLPDGFVKYGINTSLGMVSNQATIIMGPLLLGLYGAIPEEVAMFKVTTIIPFNLMIVPGVIFTTDFVHISESYKDSGVLIKYYKDYVKTLFSISIIPVILLFIFSEDLIFYLFGAEYVLINTEFRLLLLSIYVALFLRIPAGNILSAVGKASWNVYNTYFWLVIYLPLSLLLYNSFGIMGFAISLGVVFVFSGFVGVFMLTRYLKTI